MSEESTVHDELARLIEIVKTLRGPDGCAWDRAQTSQSLAPYFLEEAFEVYESINEQNSPKLKEELGDLLLHIIFQAELAAESDTFSLMDSLRHISIKLIRRHPHVFDDVVVNDINDIKKNWEAIKLREGRRSLMDGIPKSMPALLQARRVQERAAEVGFDWDRIEAVWIKIQEEIEELHNAIATRTESQIKEELGDLLFSLVNLSRHLNLNPDTALRSSIRKFIQRFQYIEKELKARKMSLKDATLEEMDRLWNQIRKENHSSDNQES